MRVDHRGYSLKFNRIFKSCLLSMVFILLILSIISDPTSISGVSIQEEPILFIAENSADYNLAAALNQSLSSTGDIIDIRTAEDLNILFFDQNYLKTYSRIIMILNQVSSPFNQTVVDNIEKFVQEGGVFGIISPKIWRFPTTFHTLLGLSVSSGQKEWPSGSTVGNITLTIVNDTFTQTPFQIGKNSTVEVVGSLGITTPIDDSYRIATSQDTPIGNATITGFVRQTGFIIAVPLSLNEFNSTFNPFNQLLTSIITSGIELSETSQLNSPEIPFLPWFSISEEAVQAGVAVVSVTFLLLGLIYLISKWAFQPKDIEIPKDRDWFSIIFLTPTFVNWANTLSPLY